MDPVKDTHQSLLGVCSKATLLHARIPGIAAQKQVVEPPQPGEALGFRVPLDPLQDPC